MNEEWIGFDTIDGARLAVKHRWRDIGGQPVLFLHGLAVNSGLWDIPDLTCGDRPYQSLSTFLATAGFDVWLANFRGHGPPEGRSRPVPGQRDYCIDDFVVSDLPALVRGVSRETGRQPIVIGASMGAMVAAAYLTGARLKESNGSPPPRAIEACPVLAAQRQDELAAAVFFDFPAALRWPASLFSGQGCLQWASLLRRSGGSDCNFAYELLSRMAWLEVMLGAVGRVPLDWLRPAPGWQERRARLPRGLQAIAAGWERALSRGFAAVANAWKGSPNMHPDLFQHGLRFIGDHVRSGVLKQLARSVRAGSFVSGWGDEPLDYASGYPNIRLPVCVVMGDRDNIANAAVTRSVFLDRIASADKEMHVFPGYAHGDSEYAITAPERVYPVVLDWLIRH